MLDPDLESPPLRRPRHPPGPSGTPSAPTCSTRRRACQGARGARDGAAGGDARRAGARARGGVPRRHRGHAGPRRDARCRHVHLAGVTCRCRAAGGGRGRAGGRGRPRAGDRPHRAACALVRPAGPPRRGDRAWGSASTTTSPSPRRTRVRAASRASPSSTTTCTTATARSGCSTPIRRCSTSRPTSSRSIRAPAPPTRSGGDGRGFTVNMPLEAGATDGDYVPCLRLGRAAGARRVRAGADARFGRLRRARARPAGADAHDGGGLRVDDRAAALRCRPRMRDGARARDRRGLRPAGAAARPGLALARCRRADAVPARRRVARPPRPRRRALCTRLPPPRRPVAWHYNFDRGRLQPQELERNGRSAGRRPRVRGRPKTRRSRSSTASRCSRTRPGTRTSATSATTSSAT